MNQHEGVARRRQLLLPSDPVAMPFHGPFEGLSIQADQDRSMSLPQRITELTADLQDKLAALRKEHARARIEFRKAWGDHERQADARRKAMESDDYEMGDLDSELAWLERNEEYMDAMRPYTQQLNTINHQMNDVRRQINLTIIEDTILRVGMAKPGRDRETGNKFIDWSWPEDRGMEQPDFRSPETLADWPDTVLSWLAEDAQEAVRQQLQNPNSGGR